MKFGSLMTKQPMRRISIRAVVVTAAMSLLAAMVIAGCGGSGSSATAEGPVSKTDLARYEKELAPFWAGTSTKPVGGPVSTTPGKKIWVVAAGMSVEAASIIAGTIEHVDGQLGWNTTVFDGKFESNRWLTGVQQAVAAGAEGIILLYVDCAPIKSALEEAKKAGISVVGLESRDCNPSLENQVQMSNGMNFEDWARASGRLIAKYLIAETKGEAKAILVEETDTVLTVLLNVGVREQFAKCPTCEVVDTVKFTGASFNTLQQKIEQALNQYPEANSLYTLYDGVMTTGGGAAAVRNSGRLSELVVAGGEGSAPGIELIRNDEGLDACQGSSLPWLGYESVTLMARIFAGQNPAESNDGMGFELCDREHNMPPKGDAYQPSIDFVKAYEEILGLK